MDRRAVRTTANETARPAVAPYREWSMAADDRDIRSRFCYQAGMETSGRARWLNRTVLGIGLATQKLTPQLGPARAAGVAVTLNVLHAGSALVAGWLADRSNKRVVLNASQAAGVSCSELFRCYRSACATAGLTPGGR